MTDVYLFQTPNDGDVNLQADGTFELDEGGLRTAAFISMFGGNEDGPDWWGDVIETDPAGRYRAETQRLLKVLAPTSGNLLKLQEAVERDLAWLIDVGAATAVEAEASIPALNTAGLSILVTGPDESETRLEYQENWRASV